MCPFACCLLAPCLNDATRLQNTPGFACLAVMELFSRSSRALQLHDSLTVTKALFNVFPNSRNYGLSARW